MKKHFIASFKNGDDCIVLRLRQLGNSDYFDIMLDLETSKFLVDRFYERLISELCQDIKNGDDYIVLKLRELGNSDYFNIMLDLETSKFLVDGFIILRSRLLGNSDYFDIMLDLETSKFLVDRFYERLSSGLYQDMLNDGTCSK